jgi:hypothetical protein
VSAATLAASSSIELHAFAHAVSAGGSNDATCRFSATVTPLG